MPFPDCPRRCDGCHQELDASASLPGAHHLQTCKRRASRLEDDVQRGWATLHPGQDGRRPQGSTPDAYPLIPNHK
eukprot:532217-Hanusia_phi.AAC.1